MNQTDLRVVRSKMAIKEAFLDLMDEISYENITIKAISERAMINRKTFYNHYDSVDTLLADILQSTIDTLMKDLLTDDRKSYPQSSDELYRDVKLYLHNLSKNARVINTLFNDVSSHALSKHLGEEILQKFFIKVTMLHTWRKTSNVPVELVGISLSAIFLAITKWYLNNKDAYSEEDAARMFMELITKRLF